MCNSPSNNIWHVANQQSLPEPWCLGLLLRVSHIGTEYLLDWPYLHSSLFRGQIDTVWSKTPVIQKHTHLAGYSKGLEVKSQDPPLPPPLASLCFGTFRVWTLQAWSVNALLHSCLTQQYENIIRELGPSFHSVIFSISVMFPFMVINGWSNFKHHMEVLGWPKSSLGFFHKMLQENPNELFGQYNTITAGEEDGVSFHWREKPF